MGQTHIGLAGQSQGKQTLALLALLVLLAFWVGRPGVNGSSCTWRVAKEHKRINSTCVNANIDQVVEAHGKVGD